MCILVFFVSSAHYKKVQSFSLYFLYFLGKQQYGFLKAIKRGISFFNIHVHNISFFHLVCPKKLRFSFFAKNFVAIFIFEKWSIFCTDFFGTKIPPVLFHRKKCFLTINKKSFIKNVYPNYYQLIPSFILVSI